MIGLATNGFLQDSIEVPTDVYLPVIVTKLGEGKIEAKLTDTLSATITVKVKGKVRI